MTVHPHQPYSPAPPSSAASVAEHIPSYAGSRLIGLRAVCNNVSLSGGAQPLPPLFPRLASAASAGGSAPCDCRARFHAAFRWLFFRAPAAQIASGFDRFRGCSALTASTVSRPSMLGRRLGARRRAARMSEASEEQEREKRREGKEGASPSSPSWMARRDGPWRV